MRQTDDSTATAGVDVSKRWLDAAVHEAADERRFANTAQGRAELMTWLHERRVGRVGMEASGGYERGLREDLAAAGVEAVLHQPLEVRLYAKLTRVKAKSDRIDARLIAAATARLDTVRACADPALADLAERLTAYEQVADLIGQLRNGLEHVAATDLRALLEAQIESLLTLKATLAADATRRVDADPRLSARRALLQSLPGVGPIVACQLVVRMPELGRLEHGQAAALLGVAPFDRDSGALRGKRFVRGGRSRPRRYLYLAAVVAKRTDPAFKIFAARLVAAGKPPKVATVAVMRKLIEAANLVLKRARPWTEQPA